MTKSTLLVGIALLSTAAEAQAPAADNAALFGARPTVMDMSLSPDGSQIAYVSPLAGQGAKILVRPTNVDGDGKAITRTGDKSDRLSGCSWVSNQRMVCFIHGVLSTAEYGILPFSRRVAVDSDGSNAKMLETSTNRDSHGFALSDGRIIDWLPDENGAILMARANIASDRSNNLAASQKQGYSVDRIDTLTLKATTVESPKNRVTDYITDGRGLVRIMGYTGVSGASNQLSGLTTYSYRRQGSHDYEPLSVYNSITFEGFVPVAVDHDRNIAYGFKRTDGRDAFYSMALDGSLTSTLLYARPDVDIDGVLQIGRRQRVVGVSFQTDKRESYYFDPEIKGLVTALSRALPKQPIVQVVDSSIDERKLLIFAGSDNDPGVYYLFNRDTKDLHILMAARPELLGRSLATMKPIKYKAADGTIIPAYLTLPPGKEDARGLPAIVMPHGGPGYRDEWGFDWLPQFYAAQGYAVLQPEFRGSTGYGDAWYQKNGFRSWRTAIGDVVDAGRWLVSENIANPAKLAIVGWSYGGYAALQSATVAPDLYKAVVAIAPVTDLAKLKSQYDDWNSSVLARAFIGSGPDVIRDGSPSLNANKIKAPVLLVHGTMDFNVPFSQSTFMQSRLQAAGDKVQLITFEGLDHQLDDSDARAKMLRESDAFIKAATGG